MARRTVNTVGARERSSSVKARLGSATFNVAAPTPLSRSVTSSRASTARTIAGSITCPRPFKASIRIERPLALMTSGGSMIAVSHRV